MSPPSLRPKISRAARALLDWSLKDLSKNTGISVATLSHFEVGRPSYPATVDKIAAIYEEHGVELVNGKGKSGALIDNSAFDHPLPGALENELLEVAVSAFRVLVTDEELKEIVVDDFKSLSSDPALATSAMSGIASHYLGLPKKASSEKTRAAANLIKEIDNYFDKIDEARMVRQLSLDESIAFLVFAARNMLVAYEAFDAAVGAISAVQPHLRGGHKTGEKKKRDADERWRGEMLPIFIALRTKTPLLSQRSLEEKGRELFERIHGTRRLPEPERVIQQISDWERSGILPRSTQNRKGITSSSS